MNKGDIPGDGPAQRFVRTIFFGSPDKPEGRCISCSSTKVGRQDFKDAISWKEFQITNMCQKCQDSVYDTLEEEDE